MLGTLAWGFFATSASMSTGAIVDSGSLMKSVAFPRVPESGLRLGSRFCAGRHGTAALKTEKKRLPMPSA